MHIALPSPIHALHHPLLEEKKVQLFVKRDDLIHPHISGNKWRKLKYTLQDAQQKGKKHLITFGGAYSNHLLATACAAKQLGFTCTGFVRGEETLPLNPVLSLCTAFGMQLHYVDRTSYRNKQDIFNQYFTNDTHAYFIDEGGASALAAKGVAELIDELPETYTHIFTACGTGATLAGISQGLQQHMLPTKAIGIAVLKGADFLKQDVSALAPKAQNWDILLQYHQGGYAKTTPHLINWMQDFSQQTALPIEPVYTGKLFYALFDLIAADYFEQNSKILAIHTGGISTQ